MTDSVYKSPEASLLGESEDQASEFYVVSLFKFSVLFLSTFGLYSVYWFYKNWKLRKDKYEDDIWPIARGIFSIFFAHSLFSNINDELAERGEQWNYRLWALLYVLFSVMGNFVDRIVYEEVWASYVDVLAMLFIPLTLLVMLPAQKTINRSLNDPEGESNSHFSFVNVLWIVPGGLFWLAVIAGSLITLGVISEPII